MEEIAIITEIKKDKIMKYQPYDYQAYAENFILEHKRAGLFLDMGMGKTVITLTAIEKLLYDYFCVNKVLVIAPLRVAKETWGTEASKWEHLSDLKLSLIMGNSKERIQALNTKADIYIINRENIAWLVEYYKRKWCFDMVVVDELSSFKSSKSKRFRALRKVRPYIKRIVGLTGTPASNGLIDLWSQVYLLDEGESLGKTLTGYRDRYFLPDKRNGQVIFSWKLKEDAEKAIYKELANTCISMQSAEYLKLPKSLSLKREFELSAATMATYKQLERDMLLPFEDGDIDAATAGVLTNKLLQLVGGAVYDENGKAKVIHDEKLKALDELIEETNGQPVLIFYSFKHELARILERYPQAMDIKAEGAMAKWNKGEVPILLAHPASAGHGLNLQFGGHIVIWYSLPTSLELYQQANKRLHRQGQKETVLIHHLLMKDTYDIVILEDILTPKAERQDALLNALKARIRQRQNKF